MIVYQVSYLSRFFQRPVRLASLLVLLLVPIVGSLIPAKAALADLRAFPGAVGQGADVVGGRGGDVYHVTTLDDYNSEKEETKIKGSLRHAIDSAEGPRTIVFDVAGPIKLACRLSIYKAKHLTLAGQTSPGGITLWGYPTDLSESSDIIIRYIRFRTGDFNAAITDDEGTPVDPPRGNGNKDLLANTANAVDVGNGCERIIIDHVSATWAMDEGLTVSNCRNVTIQNSIIAEALSDSFHYKGPHGYGSLVRGLLTAQDQAQGVGGYTFYGNLWAHNLARNPSIGGQQRLAPNQSEVDRGRTDVNLVNNVVYDWGQQATHRSQLGDVRINLVGNYYVNGPSKKTKHFFREGEAGHTFLYHHDNYHDADQDSDHDGRLIDTPEESAIAFYHVDDADQFLGQHEGSPFNFFDTVQEYVIPGEAAYDRVIQLAGASLWPRDAVDLRVIDDLVHRSGRIIKSQEEFRDSDGKMPGIDDLPTANRPSDFDTDGDGMPNEFETSNGLDPNDPADRNSTNLSPSGYTNLEVYLNSLVDDPMGHDNS